MKDAARFRLRITAFTPDTIPMARLAEYMQELAALMGSEQSVHYKGATKGSTILQVEVEPQDIAQVEERLRAATAPGAPEELSRAYARLDTLMRADDARGTLSRAGGEQFLKFLGRDAVMVERIGPIKEATTLEGELVRIGGKDETVHATLVGDEGQEYKIVTRNRDAAKRLAQHLFGKLRVTGTGTWFRTEDGTWELEKLTLEEFEPLETRSLAEAIADLRAIGESGWTRVPDPLKFARNVRKH